MTIGSTPKFDAGDIGDVGAENDERRMRDIDDVEHAERDRDAGGDRGIKAAEQKPGGDRVDQEICGNIHAQFNRHSRGRASSFEFRCGGRECGMPALFPL